MSAKSNVKSGYKARTFMYQSILNIILFLISATMILPFIYIIMVSFTDASVYEPGKFILWPRKWSVSAYRFILNGNGFLNAFKSTLFITLVGTPLHVIVCSGMGYMLARKTLPARNILNKLVMFTMLFGAGMIPNYINMSNLRLLNSWFACILPGTCGAWTVMVMKSFFQSLPEELEEAAIIDGASQLKIFFTIVLPLSKAMLATFTLFGAVSYWNTYFSAVIYITKSSLQPLQVFLQKIVLSSNFSDVLDVTSELAKTVPTEISKMATVVIAVLPIICIYPFLQKHFTKGVMIGAVKG